MEHISNTIILRGALQDLPRFSHENHGRKFYRLTLAVERLSGATDLIPVIAEEHLVMNLDPCGGEMIYAEGQVRSHNYRTETGRRLLIFVFASSLSAEDGPPVNDCTVEGVLCKEPVFRRTPLGREICDIMLAIPRAFHRADYLPCILWGKTAKEIAQCHVRDKIRICGRLQSRIYTKLTEEGPIERTTYELSALSAQICD